VPPTLPALPAKKDSQLKVINEPKQLSKTSTVQTVFKPTASMKLWIATSADLMTNNISEIADECGIDRTSWYKWLKKPGFLEWFEKEKERYMVLLRHKLDNIGVQKASNDFKYWKAMQKIAGRDVSEEAPAAPSSAVQFNFNSNKYVKEKE